MNILRLWLKGDGKSWSCFFVVVVVLFLFCFVCLFVVVVFLGGINETFWKLPTTMSYDWWKSLVKQRDVGYISIGSLVCHLLICVISCLNVYILFTKTKTKTKSKCSSELYPGFVNLIVYISELHKKMWVFNYQCWAQKLNVAISQISFMCDKCPT